MYTTPLDRQSESYRSKLHRAEKVAGDIERDLLAGGGKNNGFNGFGNGGDGEVDGDEEMRFGAVLKRGGDGSFYVPPAARSSTSTTSVVNPKPSPTTTTTVTSVAAVQVPVVVKKNAPQPPVPPKTPPSTTTTTTNQSRSTTSTITSGTGGKTLDPHAASFKFNLGALEFKPVLSSAATSPTPTPHLQNQKGTNVSKVQTKPAKAQQFHRNIFGKNMPIIRRAVRESLFAAFDVEDAAKLASLIGITIHIIFN